MVKIFKGLYINPLTVIFFVVCYISGKASYFLISYASMFIHELAHLVAACFIGLKPMRITLHPFGINLKLKSNIVSGICEDIILYLSGPLINLIIALVFITILKVIELYQYGFAVNVMLFAINFLPICPLDGGNILKRIMLEYLSENNVNIIIKTISAILAIGVFMFGIYVVSVSRYNYSAIFISILMFSNIFTVSEKYSQTALKNLIYTKRITKNKTGKPMRIYVSEETELTGFLKYLRPGVFTCVAIIGADGKIKKMITERELLTQSLSIFED